MKFFAALTLCLGFMGLLAPAALAGSAPDTIADVIVAAANKPDITPDSLPNDFARLARFVRHDGKGMVLFSDGGSTDGYVRHAQAHFDTTAPSVMAATKTPLFTIAFELVDQQDFTFSGFSAALAARLGTPSDSSDQAGATFRMWTLKQPNGRIVRVDRGQASDNGDSVTIVQIMQNR
ncbi:MAG TPA: hypothetical protein VL899_01120 [Alphaproteobacteria bacterium]|jgi:hypothetical protein|nr:hypothetical protein [Alphaproteobacteria bacterium]